jgi:hypothetical protein
MKIAHQTRKQMVRGVRVPKTTTPPATVHMPLPEELDDPEALLRRIHQMLDGDDYWLDRLRRVLSEAGFSVRCIEREEAHPIWVIRLKRGSFDLSVDNRVASRQIRRVLVKSGIKVRAGELNVIEQRGDRLRCVFILSCGRAGFLSCTQSTA